MIFTKCLIFQQFLTFDPCDFHETETLMKFSCHMVINMSLNCTAKFTALHKTVQRSAQRVAQ